MLASASTFIDSFTGRNPSYCFVDLHSQDNADRAMQALPGHHVRGRPVKVNIKTKRKGEHAARLPTKTHDRGWRAHEVPSLDVNENAHVFDRWNRADAAKHWTAPMDEGRCVYVGGLPQVPNQDSLNAEMRVLFQGWNIEAVSKIIPPSEYKRHLSGSHHYCFVDLSNERDVHDAIAALDGTSTAYGGNYKMQIARPLQRPTKVMREQLGVTEPEREKSPKRDLQGSWRRRD
ncbi:hypothetical protein LTR08_007876 [Meristemomyces frigidus]|nr:hypothetical protein LTR08_007876 [Meristemomyces frigidus]